MARLRAPGPCLTYGLIRALISIALSYALIASDAEFWALALTCGFVFVAPMLAMGLYEAGADSSLGRSHIGRDLIVRGAFRQDPSRLVLAVDLLVLGADRADRLRASPLPLAPDRGRLRDVRAQHLGWTYDADDGNRGRRRNRLSHLLCSCCLGANAARREDERVCRHRDERTCRGGQFWTDGAMGRDRRNADLGHRGDRLPGAYGRIPMARQAGAYRELVPGPLPA